MNKNIIFGDCKKQRKNLILLNHFFNYFFYVVFIVNVVAGHAPLRKLSRKEKLNLNHRLLKNY